MGFINSVENFANKIGHDVGHAVHDAGKAVDHAVAAAAHGISSGLNFIIQQEIQQAEQNAKTADSIGDWFKNTFNDKGHGDAVL